MTKSLENPEITRESNPFVNSTHIEYWDLEGTNRVLSTRGALNLSCSDIKDKADRLRAAHKAGEMKKRGKVAAKMSKQSQARMADYFSSVHPVFKNIRKGRTSYGLFLTYGREFSSPKDGKPEIEALQKRIKRKYGTCPAIWGLECQSKRQAPHFNLMISLPKDDESFIQWVTAAWIEITGLGGSSLSDRQKHAVKAVRLYNLDGAIAYFLQELGKKEQKEFENGIEPGRWWGVWERSEMKKYWRYPKRLPIGYGCGRMIECCELYDLKFEKEIVRRNGRLDWVWFVRTRWFGHAASYIILDKASHWEMLVEMKERKELKHDTPISATDGYAFAGSR